MQIARAQQPIRVWSHRRRRVVAALMCAGLCLCAAASPFAAQDIQWHSFVEDARAAAKKSNKPVYAFIFFARQTACMRMRFETFKNPEVIELLGGYECCAVDAAEPSNKAFVDKYALGVMRDPVHGVKFGMMPANLFTDADGHEHYIRWGYIPSSGFGVMLLNVLRLVELEAAVERAPDDARAHADLGRVLLDLDMQTNTVALAKLKQHLERAVALDPDNKAGALEDALLNLRILEIPGDPARGFALLAQFLKDFPDTKHKPRVVFYQAAALCGEAEQAADKDDQKTAKAKYRQAFELLRPFKIPRGDTTSIWATAPSVLQALVLEKQLGVYLGVYK